MKILGTLFSSEALVKIMRLFLMNPDTPFEDRDIMSRCKIGPDSLRTELGILRKVDFIRKRSFFKDTSQRTKNDTPRKKRVGGWILNEHFPLVDPLQNLLVESELIESGDLASRIRTTGSIKLLVATGIFKHREDRPLDIMVVGDRINKKKLQSVIQMIESEIGKELRYAVFTQKEFEYRKNMCDKLLRDLFEYPHEKIINALNVSEE